MIPEYIGLYQRRDPMETQIKQSTSACIWMQAGVIKNKSCFKEFHCGDCRFDQAMARVCRNNQIAETHLETRREISHRKSDQFVFWQEKMNKKPLAKRLCIHHMKGHIDFKACPKSYHCIDCEFDQFFQDQFKVYAQVKPVTYDEVKGFSLPAGYYLSSGHTWIRIEGDGMVRLGIDDFACKLLGRFDTLSAPLMGKKLSKGKPAFTLGREKNSITFTSPVNGVITEANLDVQKTPNHITAAPYTDGWILTLFCPDLKKDLKKLMFMETATGFMDESATTLHHYIETRTGLMAADGGQLVDDIYGNLPEKSWQELTDLIVGAPL